MSKVLVIIGTVFAVACGSRDVPPASPAASSNTVEQATDSPNNGPDFSPASQDGTFQPAPAGANAADPSTVDPSQPPAAGNGAAPGAVTPPSP